MISRKFQSNSKQKNRWMITYADFMTLMFALVTSLYSISLYNETMLEGFVEKLDHIFNPTNSKKSDPTKPDTLTDILTKNQILQETKLSRKNTKKTVPKQSAIANANKQILSIKSKKRSGSNSSSNNVTDHVSHIRQEQNYIEIELDSNVMFKSGNANLSLRATPILRTVAETLKKVEFPIRVEGYTDNIPISNALFASNWELSVYRASKVVRELIRHGVNPYQLAVVGYGAEHPVASNNTAEGRNQNRRVIIVVNASDLNP